MGERLLVIGGDAAGMSAASQAKRLRRDALEVVVLERGPWTSYSACGIPYWVAGDVPDADALVARTPAQHRANGIDVRLRTEATGIDLDAGQVEVRDADSGRQRLGFDQLMIATGAVPVRPAVPGIDCRGIYGVQTLDDGCRLIDGLRGAPRRAVVVGAGYIGVEMAEALLRHGLEVTVIDQAGEPMSALDPDLGRLVREAMEKMGIGLVLSTPVEAFEADASGGVRAVAAGGATYESDVVVLGLGVQPETSLARAAGLPLGARGALRTEASMRVRGQAAVWAAGDCVESFDRVSGTWVHVPLGTHANKQGRVAGLNIGGRDAAFPGIVRTAISKVCDLEIARTGMGEADVQAAGLSYVTSTIETTTRAGYFPGTAPMTVKLLAESATGRLLGAQIVGREGSAKRIDTCAVALWSRLSVEQLMMCDLSYAPPFSSVWDPVQLAARAVVGKLVAGEPVAAEPVTGG
jgi:NADPH-dependent 2,4-dienoyl-CoA reductase/sulfur reductase-like enzyme